MKVLIVVDMQNDFVTGTLKTKRAEAILPYVVEKVKSFDGEIFCTLDTHREDYLETQEGRNLPVLHCRVGTEGWRMPEALHLPCEEKQAKYFEKSSFGSMDLVQELLEREKKGAPLSVEIVGICTDICVVTQALLIKAALPEISVAVDARGCDGTTAKKHEAALSVMESVQIEVKR